MLLSLKRTDKLYFLNDVVPKRQPIHLTQVNWTRPFLPTSDIDLRILRGKTGVLLLTKNEKEIKNVEKEDVVIDNFTPTMFNQVSMILAKHPQVESRKHYRVIVQTIFYENDEPQHLESEMYIKRKDLLITVLSDSAKPKMKIIAWEKKSRKKMRILTGSNGFHVESDD